METPVLTQLLLSEMAAVLKVFFFLIVSHCYCYAHIMEQVGRHDFLGVSCYLLLSLL